jgi:hypothetical protein
MGQIQQNGHAAELTTYKIQAAQLRKLMECKNVEVLVVAVLVPEQRV